MCVTSDQLIPGSRTKAGDVPTQTLGPGISRKDSMKKRIKHNDLLPWFIQDHKQLPAGYLKSCRRFFESLKPQATSRKLDKQPGMCYRRIKEKV